MLLRNNQVLWRELDGEAILLDPQQGCSYNLNGVGTFIWKLLDGAHSIDELVAAISAAYEVDENQARSDLESLLHDLRLNNLVSA